MSKQKQIVFLGICQKQVFFNPEENVFFCFCHFYLLPVGMFRSYLRIFFSCSFNSSGKNPKSLNIYILVGLATNQIFHQTFPLEVAVGIKHLLAMCC